MRFLLTVLVFVLSSCGIYRAGTDPDAMSEAEHRELAASYRRRSRSHRSHYEPGTVRVAETGHGSYTGLPGGGDPGATHASAPGQVYNPTEGHLRDARRQRELAAEHEAAADALVQYEDSACADIERTHRAACPLLGSVAEVVDVPGGVRLALAPGANPAEVARHARCHTAFGRTLGGHGMDHCPLYLRGVTVEFDADGVTLTTRDDVDELRRRAADHVITSPSVDSP